jgi:hypothetical protein
MSENGAQPPPVMLMLSQEALQRIADYLQARPWAEVNDLLALLVAAQPVPEQQPVRKR